MNFLHHLFLPNESNGYRPKILHHKVLLSLIVFFFSAGLLLSAVKTNFPAVLGTAADISSDQLLSITNQKRAENGLPPLTLNGQLSQAAVSKASDMFSKDYWAHVAPDGTTPWVFIKAQGYNYIYAGENLARGYYSAPEVVNAWMASPEHRDNILSPKYQNVGFSISNGKLSGEDTVLIVEMLGSTSLAVAEPASPNTQAAAAVVSAPNTQEEVAAPVQVQEEEPSPTPLPSAKPIASANKAVISEESSTKPLVSVQSLSVGPARVVVSLFMFVLILDLVLIERKKIVRFVGHNLDHVFFFGLILALVLLLFRGAVI